jgi:hypothetical protein
MKRFLFLAILTVACFATTPVTRTATGTVSSSDVTGALGFTPLSPTNNLSDLASASTGRTNLGLGGAATQAPILSGTSSAISGTLTGVGACTSATTVSVTGARNTMAVYATPATSPGIGVSWVAWVSSNDTVSVQVCSLLATISLTSSVYNVRVIQ